MKIEDTKRAVKAARAVYDGAQHELSEWLFIGDEWHTRENFAWHVERTFVMLETVAEAVGLEHFRFSVAALHSEARKGDYAETKMGPEEPYSVWLSKLYIYLAALEALTGDTKAPQLTKDIESILRESIYAITDTQLFSHPPRSENDVHIRIESILKCLFPDLSHKPRLPKPIKNFEPDTGLPSINTLIEYKFLDSPSTVPTIVDQILADTRGYSSPGWNRFIYVIYETNRYRSEKEWTELLRKSGVPRNTTLVVLSGVPSKKQRRRPAKKKTTNKEKGKSA